METRRSDQEDQGEKHEGSKSRINSFLSGSNHADDVNSSKLGGSKPMADLYLNCTVMFGDIVGFTAWSSVREPTQVFQLLESGAFALMGLLSRKSPRTDTCFPRFPVYGSFDRLAKRYVYAHGRLKKLLILPGTDPCFPPLSSRKVFKVETVSVFFVL